MLIIIIMSHSHTDTHNHSDTDLTIILSIRLRIISRPILNNFGSYLMKLGVYITNSQATAIIIIILLKLVVPAQRVL